MIGTLSPTTRSLNALSQAKLVVVQPVKQHPPCDQGVASRVTLQVKLIQFHSVQIGPPFVSEYLPAL